jgi:hypothetical protein
MVLRSEEIKGPSMDGIYHLQENRNRINKRMIETDEEKFTLSISTTTLAPRALVGTLNAIHCSAEEKGM